MKKSLRRDMKHRIFWFFQEAGGNWIGNVLPGHSDGKCTP
jgi:hypothetical protein